VAYQEKDFQVTFNKWAKSLYRRTAAFELKISKTGSLPFKSVVEHQENALYLAKHHSVMFKIPDAGYQNPFDAFMLAEVPAWVVIMFNTERSKNRSTFIMIDIDMWMREKKHCDRKSITEERAREIGRINSL